MKIKDKLLTFFLLLAVLPLVVLGSFSSLSATGALKSQADAHFSNTLELISLMIASRTINLYQASQSLGEDQNIMEKLNRRASMTPIEWLATEREIQIRMVNSRLQNPDIRSIFIVSRDHPVISSGVPTSWENQHFRTRFHGSDLYTQILAGSNLPFWITGYENNFDRIYLFRRLQNMITGNVIGILVLSIDPGAFSSIMKQTLDNSAAEMVLTNATGQVVAAWPGELAGTPYHTHQPRLRTGRMERSLPMVQGWTLVMSQSLDSILQGTRSLGPAIILFSVFLGFLSMFVSLALTEHFSRPIFILLGAMKQAESGVFAQVHENRKDEFQQLFHGYNAMTVQLGELFQDLNASLAEISRHKQEMEEYNARLEETVRERTSRLLQSEKMAALGGLVAGVAHEINTPLGLGITSMTYLQDAMVDLKRLVKSDKLTRSALEHFLESASSATDIAQGNLRRAADLVISFKRIAVDQSTEEKRVFNLRENLEDTIRSLGPRIAEGKQTVQIDCPEDITIHSYPGIFYQIISNLIINCLIHAWDSPEQAGTVSIRAARQGKTLALMVEDTGKGIDEETRMMVFEPFFTTKREAGGSGLGLYIVYNLVTQNLDGQIQCISEQGTGTSFIITIPI